MVIYSPVWYILHAHVVMTYVLGMGISNVTLYQMWPYVKFWNRHIWTYKDGIYYIKSYTYMQNIWNLIYVSGLYVCHFGHMFFEYQHMSIILVLYMSPYAVIDLLYVSAHHYLKGLKSQTLCSPWWKVNMCTIRDTHTFLILTYLCSHED